MRWIDSKTRGGVVSKWTLALNVVESPLFFNESTCARGVLGVADYAINVGGMWPYRRRIRRCLWLSF